MATLRNKRKSAAVTRETPEEHPTNGQSRNTSVPRINEEYITQVFEKIEGRVTKKLSQEFSRTESRVLGALSKLDEFRLNPQIRTHSGTFPVTFRNTNVENQGTKKSDSQSDPHPEAGIFRSQTTQRSGPEVGPDIVAGVQEEIRQRTDMLTGIQEDIPFCSRGTSSGKRKRTRSTSHPNFAERTPLRQLEQTSFCRPFSSWRVIAAPPTSTTTITKFRNCLDSSKFFLSDSLKITIVFCSTKLSPALCEIEKLTFQHKFQLASTCLSKCTFVRFSN